MTGRSVLIGVGNPSRRDDGVGWAAAEAARQRIDQRVRVWQSDGEPARLLAAWAGVAFAVVIDAMHSGAEPGTIRVFQSEDMPLPARSVGSHAHGIAYAVALGRVLHQLPDQLVVVGIEAQETGFGEGLSPRVAAAVDTTVDLVDRLFEAPGQRLVPDGIGRGHGLGSAGSR